MTTTAPKVLHIGLTGGVASGKSTAAQLFSHYGVTVIDADEIAATLTAANGAALPAIRTALGNWAFDDKGTLNRRRVRERIFVDSALRQRLESVLHPMIRIAIRQALQAATSSYTISVIPLLFEKNGWRDIFHRTLIIHCTPALQAQRLSQRDNRHDAAAIMATQWTTDQRLAVADDAIDNNGDLAALQQEVDRLHKRYTASMVDGLAQPLPANTLAAL